MCQVGELGIDGAHLSQRATSIAKSEWQYMGEKGQRYIWRVSITTPLYIYIYIGEISASVFMCVFACLPRKDVVTHDTHTHSKLADRH